MDYGACMRDEDNIDDPLSLSHLKGWLGFDIITNKDSKIKQSGNFEVHDQFINEIGMQFLTNAFENFLDANSEVINVVDSNGAQKLILDFLDQNEIRFLFDPDTSEELDKFDDLLTYCKDLAGRTVLSLVTDKMEAEGDALGLRGLRIGMICYFLNRKQDKQDSKYAFALLFDLVQELTASPRTRARMDNTVVINTSGRPGDGKLRVMVNEHVIAETKRAIKGMHSNLKDLNVAKTISSLSIVNQVTAHDMKSMLSEGSSSHSSHDYIGDDRRLLISKEIAKVNPFSRNREKVKEFYEKSRGSAFSGLNMNKIEKFLTRNKRNFKRNYCDKIV